MSTTRTNQHLIEKERLEMISKTIELVIVSISACLPVGAVSSGLVLLYVMPLTVQNEPRLTEQDAALIAIACCVGTTWVCGLLLFGVVERVMGIIKSGKERDENDGTRRVSVRNVHGVRSIRLRKR